MATPPAVIQHTYPIGTTELFTAKVVNKLTGLPPASASCSLTIYDAAGAPVTSVNGTVDGAGNLVLNAPPQALTEGAPYRFVLVVQENASTKRTLSWWARAVMEEADVTR